MSEPYNNIALKLFYISLPYFQSMLEWILFVAGQTLEPRCAIWVFEPAAAVFAL